MHPVLRISIWAMFYAGGLAVFAFAGAVVLMLATLASIVVGAR